VVPWTTESVLTPAIESTADLDAGEDFSVAYSPERASPGHEGRGVSDVVEIVGAGEQETRDELAQLYGRIVDAGVYRAPDIETAETAKVIEDVQRDLNIALVNELAIACDYMDISTAEVLEAAGTKWNFHDETEPGLVGGPLHPRRPAFLGHRSESEGFSPELVLQAREINTFLPTHAAHLMVRALNDARKILADSRILLLGLSNKANLGDIRTSEVSGVIAELETYDVDVVGFDPHAHVGVARETFDIEVQPYVDAIGCDGILVATDHDAFGEMGLEVLADAMASEPVLVDVAGAFDEAAATAAGFAFRRL
jgi:UDP-N-acetyl-D-galactosamine dehydrogenase